MTGIEEGASELEGTARRPERGAASSPRQGEGRESTAMSSKAIDAAISCPDSSKVGVVVVVVFVFRFFVFSFFCFKKKKTVLKLGLIIN